MKKKTIFEEGFTLFELLIVMIIIGILAMLATPRYLNYVRDANVVAMQYDAKVLSNAASTYQFENEVYPISTEVDITDKADLKAYLEKNGFNSETDKTYSIDGEKISAYVKNTKNPITDYLLVSGGKLDGDVFYISGVEDRDNIKQFGIVKNTPSTPSP